MSLYHVKDKITLLTSSLIKKNYQFNRQETDISSKKIYWISLLQVSVKPRLKVIKEQFCCEHRLQTRGKYSVNRSITLGDISNKFVVNTNNYKFVRKIS